MHAVVRHTALAVLVAATAYLAASAQYLVDQIRSGATLPSTCATGETFFLTGTSAGMYWCSATDTWTAASPDRILINGVAATDANLNDTTPAAPADGVNLRWQKDALTPTNISSNLIFAGAAQAGAVSTGTQTFGGAKTFQDAGLFSSWWDLAQITEPASPSAGRVRLYVVDQNGHPVLEAKGPAGLTRRLVRDSMFIGRVDEALGITAGQVVYVSGAVGANELIKLARADAEATMPAAGIALESGVQNAFIRVLFAGKVTELDTSGYTIGDTLYVSAITAGALTAAAPAHPNLNQRMGVVTRVQDKQGEILVISTGVRGNHEGTNLNAWKIGSNTTGAKDLIFRNGSDFTVRANPSTTRLATFPDAGGEISLLGQTIGTTEIEDAAVTYAKIQDVSATSRLLGRISIGAGSIEELTGAQVTTLLDIFTSGLKGLAPASGGGTVNFLRADGTWTAPPDTGITQLTGDVTAGPGSGSQGATIPNDTVTYAKMQNVSATSRFIGRIAAGAGDPEELTGTQATTLLDTFTSTLKGVAPASGGGTTNFLRADGSWVAPPGGSGGGNFVEVSVNLGTSKGLVFRTTVTGQAWVTATSKLLCTPFATTADGQTVETYEAAGLLCLVSNRVAGTGFDVSVHSPYGATGTFRFHVTGG